MALLELAQKRGPDDREIVFVAEDLHRDAFLIAQDFQSKPVVCPGKVFQEELGSIPIALLLGRDPDPQSRQLVYVDGRLGFPWDGMMLKARVSDAHNRLVDWFQPDGLGDDIALAALHFFPVHDRPGLSRQHVRVGTGQQCLLN